MRFVQHIALHQFIMRCTNRASGKRTPRHHFTPDILTNNNSFFSKLKSCIKPTPLRHKTVTLGVDVVPPDSKRIATTMRCR